MPIRCFRIRRWRLRQSVSISRKGTRKLSEGIDVLLNIKCDGRDLYHGGHEEKALLCLSIKRDLDVARCVFPLVFDILLKQSKSLQSYEGLAIMDLEP